MKKNALVRPILFAAIVLTAFASCKSSDVDPMILPRISFKTTAGYTARDTTVASGTALLTGINASKSEPNDVLKRFVISCAYDADTIGNTVFTEDLSGATGDSYSQDYIIHTRSTAGKERYTYTVVNRDGLINQVKLIITVQ